MRVSACRLLAKAWANLVAGLGTTTLSVVVFTFAIPILIFLAIFLYHHRRSRNRAGGMKDAIKGTVIPTMIGFAITLAAWVGLFAWSVLTTIYRDHAGLVERIRQLNRENADLKAKLNAKPKEIVHNWVDLQFDALRRRDRTTWDMNVYSFYRTIQPVRLKLKCVGPIQEITEIIMKTGGPNGLEVVAKWWKLIERDKSIELGFAGPALNMMNMLALEIRTRELPPETQLRVLRVEAWNSN